MKNKDIILIILVSAALLVALFAGCSLTDEMSIEDRIKDFVKDLNKENRNSIFKDHFHPDASYYDGDGEALESTFPPGKTYTIQSMSSSGKVRTVVIQDDDNITTDCIFTMREDGSDYWCIWSLNAAGVVF